MENVFQMIFDEISKYFPKKWDKVVIYLEYGELSYSFCFYIKIDDKYIKCFDLNDVKEDDLFDSFEKIDEVLSAERENTSKWTNMTIVVDSKGNLKADMDYTDLSEIAYQYEKEWKSKYLI
jgi:hypothetical protein